MTDSQSDMVKLWEAVQELLLRISACDNLATKNGGHPEGEEYVGSYTISSGLWHAVIREHQNVNAAALQYVKPAVLASTTETAKPSNQELARHRAEHALTAWGEPYQGDGNLRSFTEALARDVVALVARVEALLAERDALERREADQDRLFKAALRDISDRDGRVAVLEAALRALVENRDYMARKNHVDAVLAGGDAAPTKGEA